MPFSDATKKKEHHRAYYKEYLKDPEKKKVHLERVKKNTIIRKEAIKKALVEWKSVGCFYCDEKDPVCLDAHHLDASSKEFTIAQFVRVGGNIKKMISELEKCACVCSNCHRKLHAGRVMLPRIALDAE